ncbi:membrane protein [Kitasatospora herbaricolor]|uniref:MMPL family transporter n=1 Tax=Kitasatospora herbaricolor TaxID=68217 RepID=UPI001749EF24|nr:MMPL family transporter [Kitasatospora herbaricolor]MDQ0307660.1 RND superfamily putative drug exporter [Kitasatospora herbaricolor]GGV16016.1 membrane protein [Kitasatospora herbaricolor]
MGAWSARHRRSAVFGWLLFVVLAAYLGGVHGSTQVTESESMPGQVARAAKILDEAGIKAPASESVLVQSASLTADDPAFRAVVDQVRAAVTGTGRTADLRSPYDTQAFSADRRSALVQFTVTGDREKAVENIPAVLDAVAKVQAQHRDLTVEELGEASSGKWFEDQFADDFQRAEWTAVPLALGILLIAFGALVAAVLPVVLALTAFIAAGGLVALSSGLLHTSNDASSVMLLVGLAVGVDYCLFYLRREREERAAGHDAETALRIAAATSGRAVLVSGVTVVVAMAGMFLTGIADFQAMSYATIVVVITAVLGSLTVLPALLSMLGDRVDKGKVPLLHRLRRPESAATGGRIWNAVLTPVLRRPLAATVLAGGLLLGIAAPLLTMHTANLTFQQQLPKGNALVATSERIQAAFPGSPSPATVVVKATDIDSAAISAAIEDLKSRALASNRMHGPVDVTLHAEQNIATIDIPLMGSGNDSASTEALRTLREDIIPATLLKVPGTEAPVTGSTAGSHDFNEQMTGSMLPVFGFVVAFAFLLMLTSFRSLAVAVTAVVLNLLSVGAAYGVLTLVFQHGVGASLLGTAGVGAIDSWVPLFLFVILFGLSMDYHVFVVSRIKEGHDRGLSTQAAIAHGIRSTAGVVTSAAVIMVAVFGVFGTLSMQSMKQMGVGLAVAVLIDATIIRGVLLPAVMSLLGERNWYLPRWLGRLPDFSHTEPAPLTDRAAPAAPAGPEPGTDGARRRRVGV